MWYGFGLLLLELKGELYQIPILSCWLISFLINKTVSNPHHTTSEKTNLSKTKRERLLFLTQMFNFIFKTWLYVCVCLCPRWIFPPWSYMLSIWPVLWLFFYSLKSCHHFWLGTAWQNQRHIFPSNLVRRLKDYFLSSFNIKTNIYLWGLKNLKFYL